MADDESSSFASMKVPELQNFLKARDIQIALDGKKRKKAELLELCKNAAEMKVPKVDEEIELQDDLIKWKITLPGGKLLPHPLSLQFWTHNFTNIPDFRFPDIYYYLVGKDGYDEACLRSYKSLQGFRLYMDGHVEDLKYHSILDDSGYCYFQFKVKPTERSKTEDHYWGFLVLEISGSIYSAFCACKGGADGACRHVAAALFDLEATIRRNELDTCTSVPCMWIKRKRLEENAVPMERLKIQKSEYGKEHKDYMKPCNFNPSSGSPTQYLTNKFYDALQETAPSCVALQFIPKPEAQAVSDQQLMEQILSEDIDHEEVVEYVEVYSVKELANIFIAKNNLTSVANPTDEQCGDFVRFLDQHDFAPDVIFQKTLSQNNTSFWFSQRAGRITASNFYKVCHLKETTNPKNTVKLLMNYCPLSNDNPSQQLVWDHDKEITAVKEYVKKYKSKHRGMEVTESGLFIDDHHAYLGATPDRIQVCKCCVKILLEVKSIFSKRNLPPHIAAASYLEKVNGKYYLKKETSWNYQIQGQLAIARLTHCNLIIYTLKGILVVPVQFDEELWECMVGKLKNFFSGAHGA